MFLLRRLTWLNALLAIAIISTVVALLSWRPLKNMQSKVESKTAVNDMIGHRFRLPSELAPGQNISYRYSGIEWQLESAETLSSGSEVEISAVDVGRLTVKAV